MNKLSVISNATTIASNVTTAMAAWETRYDTRTIRKAGNKLGYALQTISTGRQLIDIMGFEGRDLQRAEALMDSFTAVARDDILKVMR